MEGYSEFKIYSEGLNIVFNHIFCSPNTLNGITLHWMMLMLLSTTRFKHLLILRCTANSMEVRRIKVYQNMSLPFVSGKEKWQLTLQSKIQCNLHSKNNHQGTTRSHWMLEIYRMDWTPLPQTVASMTLHWLWSHFLHTVWSWKSNDTYKTFYFCITLQFRHLLLQYPLLTILWCS